MGICHRTAELNVIQFSKAPEKTLQGLRLVAPVDLYTSLWQLLFKTPNYFSRLVTTIASIRLGVEPLK